MTLNAKSELKRVPVEIDGKTYMAREGRTILDVARENDIRVPTLCYHPKLKPLGSCRMCIVEVEGTPTPVAACTTPVAKGMSVRTRSAALDRLRRETLKLIFLKHPMNCAACEINGSCQLQDLAHEYDINHTDWHTYNIRPVEQESEEYATPLIRYHSRRCILCGRCEKACPTQAIDYFQQPQDFSIEARAAILATGFETLPVEDAVLYGSGKVPNVITALQMERLLAPHGPYNRVLRPSDGMEPDSIAFVQCAGSRDKTMGVPYCSRVCCMYAVKQAMLLSGALPLADITVYYMDIRAFGKNYEQFFQNAQAMGIQFVKAKVGWVSEGEEGSVLVRYEDQSGDGVVTSRHDLVVLSLGKIPAWKPEAATGIPSGPDGFVHTVRPRTAPTLTAVEGVFAAGSATGPKDIVDTIAEAGAAAMEASVYLKRWNLGSRPAA